MREKVNNIAIIGTGGLGREIVSLIESINEYEKRWHILGFYDDGEQRESVNGYPVLGKVEELNTIEEELNVVVGVGNPTIKAKILSKLHNTSLKYPTLIHPSAIIYSKEYVVIEQGVVITANCVLTVNIHVKEFAYINTAAVIAHDVQIGKRTMIMPTVSISAGAHIGDDVYIGNGVKIDYALSLANASTITAGSILSKN